MKITALYFYPVKSLAGIRVETLHLEAAGPRFDREWMVVNEAGKFITQREFPKMQLIQTSVDEESLRLKFGEDSLRIPLHAKPGALCPVEVWGTQVEASEEGKEATQFLAKTLAPGLRLVRLSPRGRQEEAGGRAYEVRFADACPLLLCAEESMAELNRRAGRELEIERFRPNIVVSGAPAFAEDSWAGITINNNNFDRIRPCTRCGVTSVDPATAERGPEPLKTLATFRKQGNKLEFGQYFFSPGPCTLRVGELFSPCA
ncbi:MAG: MOSC domain-containing protein [Proteobacteria bacterium]|nr:MAG: MOSC domain-containing protein [Pseudomonadota bacterium]